MAVTPPDPADTPRRPPVRMGLRVLARHSAGRLGGRHLAHAVVEARAPKLLPASVRLAEPALARAAARPASPPPAPPVARAPAPEAPAAARPSFAPPEMSDFAAQWLFGDPTSATDDLVSMQVAEKMPEPTREQRLARFLARGGLERSRGARIVEGAGTGPIPADELGLSEQPPDVPTVARTLAAPAPPASLPGFDAPAEPPADQPRRRLS